ncbi:MAG: hypothetical protein Q8L48_16670 [Archangium sp.]|nr:hypothetical protein [Archangium sp.]
MPPDSAAPSAASPSPAPPRRPLPPFIEILLTAGTVDCKCGGPKCPGTLARAANTAAEAAAGTSVARGTVLDKSIEFERELARLINRLSLESHFGNRPDFELARLAWTFLENQSMRAHVTEAKPGATREELFIAMNKAAFKLGYRITDMAPIS